MSSLCVQFLKNPLRTGAVCPSSRFLARKLVSGIGLEKASVVVELGPGTGAITGTIREFLNDSALFFAVELNADVIPDFRKNHPSEKIYEDSASNLPAILRKERRMSVDAVISGLPWATFPDTLQNEILDAVVSVMPQGASFSTFAYVQGMVLPTARNFRRKLNRYFSRVSQTGIVWRNFPPAFCYHCWK